MKRIILLAFIIMFAISGCGKKAERVQQTMEESQSMPSESLGITVIEETPQPTTPEANVPAATLEPQPAEPQPAAGAFEKPSTEDMQRALKNAGLYEGKIDGVIGPKTKKAVEDFQSQSGLKADGKVGPKTWDKLKPYLNTAKE